ncbi:hypothetical protein ACP70R_040145 [Stipagrostis hirtigluma subsp. patula]
MEADPATERPQPEPGASSSSPAPAPAPAPSPPRGEEERGAVAPADPASPDRCAAGGDPNPADPASPDRCAAGGDTNPAPPPSPASAAPPQQPKGEEDEVVSGDVVQLQEEAVAGAGEALRSFMEEFGDQGNDCLVQSPRLKGIATPDRPAALHFLGERYNSLLERYKQQEAKCLEECEPRYNGLKKKYTDECAERRRLYNELIELRGNIRVFCRCRPLSADEVTRGCSSVVEVDPSKETELQFVPSKKDKRVFKFDRVFGPNDDQVDVFSETAPVVRSAMDGFNVCIFAYGQTGTGKTFTMEGHPENRGVNYRALEELFRVSAERSTSIAYNFSVSILEVYNEKIRDLLDESNEQAAKRLDIKQSSDGTQEVPGLVEAPIYTIDGVWEKLKAGARNRSVGSTSANELSSRSHSLVRVTVRSEHLVTGQRSRSHIWLVDLAGSERVAKTEAEGDRLKESQFINKSLSALGDVISALASKSSHIPYRNSKLTHLLQSSLGGDCKTIMFVQISPSSTDSGETLCSLNFASRVRAVEHGPARKQVDPDESSKLKQLEQQIDKQERENAKLRALLENEKLKYASRESVIKSLHQKIRDAEQACENYQQRVIKLENELADEKKANRDTARSSRPPLAPMRQRPAPGRNSNYLPLPGPPPKSRLGKALVAQNKENMHDLMNKAPPKSRLGKALVTQNKENVLELVNKASPRVDLNKAGGRARRVSLTTIRHIPIQPKRRSSMAILPTQREQLSVLPEKRAVSRLPQLQVPRRSSLATFNSVPGTPLGAAYVPVTPEDRGGKSRRTEWGSSSKFTSPPMLAMWNSRNNVSSPHQKLGMVPGSTNGSKLCWSIQKRVTSPFRLKVGPSGAGVFNPAQREQMVAGRSGNAVRVLNLNPKRRQSVL